MSTALVIFDVDGTLVDSSRIILTAQEITAERHGLVHPGRAAGFGVVGLSLELALEALFGPAVPTADLAATYRAVFNELRHDQAFREVPFPGVEACLAELGRHPELTLAIATGKGRRGVSLMLDRFGWHDLFASVQTADDAPSKPDPAMILQAAAATGIAPEKAVMIGDSVHDVRMALAAGALPIAVEWGFQPTSLLVETGARHVAGSFAALPALIDEALARG